MTKKKIRVLCIDHEGGYGGSSRSLFYLIKNIIRLEDNIIFEVWCRKKGPIQDMYKSIGVKCIIENNIQTYSTLYRLTRNLFSFIKTTANIIKKRKFILKSCAMINKKYDLVHFNHINLYLFAAVLKLYTKTPFTFHVRTSLEDLYEGNIESLIAKKINKFSSFIFARIQVYALLKISKGLIFISDNERKSFENIIKRIKNGVVAYNIYEKKKSIKKDIILNRIKKFKILALENYSWSRGTDRLIEVANELRSMGESNCIFIVAGNMNLNSNQSKSLGLTNKKNCLEDLVKLKGLQDYFVFLGPVANPETILKSSDILISLTRRVGPWGRSIIEAMSAGLPVLASGSNSGFVNNASNGIFVKEYHPKKVAQEILKIYVNKNNYTKMSKEAIKYINTLCDSRMNVNKILKFWKKILN